MSIYQILLILYAITTVAIAEWTFGKIKRAMKVVEARDSGFPAFRRHDTQRWNRWEIYTNAVLNLSLLRILFTLIMLGSSGFVSWVLRIGHDESKPLTGCRLICMRGYYWIVTRSIIFSLMVDLQYEDDSAKTTEFDYSYYLGPNYKKNQELPKKVSTLVVGPH